MLPSDNAANKARLVIAVRPLRLIPTLRSLAYCGEWETVLARQKGGSCKVGLYLLPSMCHETVLSLRTCPLNNERMRRCHVIAIDESFKEEVVMPVPGEDSSNDG